MLDWSVLLKWTFLVTLSSPNILLIIIILVARLLRLRVTWHPWLNQTRVRYRKEQWTKIMWDILVKFLCHPIMLWIQNSFRYQPYTWSRLWWLAVSPPQRPSFLVSGKELGQRTSFWFPSALKANLRENL